MPRSSDEEQYSFDPAIHLHSIGPQSDDLRVANASYSDDFDTLDQQRREAVTTKTQAGIVIQHRAWKLAEAFRSDGTSCGGLGSPLQGRAVRTATRPNVETDKPEVPSSPPTYKMPYISSSPVGYPESSSPVHETSRKRKRELEPRNPLSHIDANVTRTKVGAFTEVASDDEDADLGTLPKKRTFHKPSEVEEQGQFTLIDAVLGTANGITAAAAPSAPLEDLINIGSADDVVRQHSPVSRTPLLIRSSNGRVTYAPHRTEAARIPYEQLVASRSKHVGGRASKSFYGIDIHQLMDEAEVEMAEHKARAKLYEDALACREVEGNAPTTGRTSKTLMWTEKYRARRFTDLVGDERTHRSVLRWLKQWDEIVFPGSARPKPRKTGANDSNEERTPRKILMLTGPPGLGKTTLAHVCAKQAGYEVQEINASDERSGAVVKGRIRDMVGTENVKGGKTGKPVCVVVDEVDGVVTGSGGSGEGGFVKALIDLVMLDQRNSRGPVRNDATSIGKKRKGDRFRQMRPLILICNDVYHPSLRPLRQSSLAEIIYMRKPPLNVVALRMQSIFDKEGVPCDGDGVRRLCEATWGVSNHKEGKSGSGTVEGDIRSIMVVAEWVAGRIRSCNDPDARLTRRWFEEHMLGDLTHGGGAARSLGRGGAKEVAERVFLEGAGFPKSHITVPKGKKDDTSAPVGVAEAHKRRAMERLREMVDTSGDIDRIMTDLFTAYPIHPYQDDTFLSKPNTGHDWLHFHDCLSAQVFSSQEWELAPYLSSSPLAFHHLFASTETKHNLYSESSNNRREGYRNRQAGNDGNHTAKDDETEAREAPFSGPSAPFQVSEAQKQHTATVSAFQSLLSLSLGRMYRSTDAVATELLPYALRILSPDVKPVVIKTGSKSSGPSNGPTSTASVRKASEKALVDRSVEAMIATGVKFDKARLEDERGGLPGQSSGWVFRMEPAIDECSTFATMEGTGGTESTRYAVRQVLDSEWKREVHRRDAEARALRGGITATHGIEPVATVAVVDGKASSGARGPTVKRDFFGRILAVTEASGSGTGNGAVEKTAAAVAQSESGVIFCSFHEGFSNAVRKPITMEELLRGL